MKIIYNMTEQKKYDVFISYSRKDLDEVSTFVEMLKTRIPTLEVWMDLEGITAADEFDEKIISAIDASSYVIFAVSPNSNSIGEGSSKWTKKELVYAKNTGKKVIPVLLNGAELNNWFLFEFGRVDCIDSTSKHQIEKLLKNIAKWSNKEFIKPNKEGNPKPLTLDEQQIFQEAQAFKHQIEKNKQLAGLVLRVAGVAILLLIIPIVVGVNRYLAYKNTYWSYTILNDSIAPYTAEISWFSFKEDYNSSRIHIPKKIKHNGTTFMVTSISREAFACNSFISITIPNSVINIGDHAFEDCDSLISITIPNSVTNIGDHAFSCCASLSSVTISKNLTSIGDYAFHSCTSLVSITIPNSVTTIGWRAFEACTSLTSITIPNSVTKIGENSFSFCNSLTSMVVDSGNGIYDSRDNCNAIIETATNTLIAGCPNTIIPNSVTSIGFGAFEDCTSLTSITIPNSVIGIGSRAFSGCKSLTSITIPNGVTEIEERAFALCDSLISITIPNSVTSIGEGAFLWCWLLEEITYKGTMQQWDDVIKDNYGWGAAKVVHCTDGDITLPE